MRTDTRNEGHAELRKVRKFSVFSERPSTTPSLNRLDFRLALSC